MKEPITCALVIPPWTHRASHPTALRRLGAGFWPPLNLMYLAGKLRTAHRVHIMDGGFYSWTGLLSELRALSPDVVGIYANTVLWHCSREFVRDLRPLLPGARIIFGGPLPTIVPDEFLETCPEADAVVLGEAEETLYDIVERVSSRDSLAGVPGTVVRSGGDLVRGPRRPFIQDLDSLPFPARDLIDHRRYVPPIGLYTKRPLTTMLSSRGCDHRCLYCFKWGGTAQRFRSPEPIVEEMDRAVREVGVREIRFWDDTFTADKDRVLAIAELVQQRAVKVDVSIGTRADCLDRDVAQALRRIGCYHVLIGVESGVQKNLDTLRKEQTLEQIEEAVRIAHEAGLRTFLTSIFGIPGETYEEGLETIRFVRRMRPDAAHFFTLCPFPGTHLYRDLDHYGTLVGGDYSILGMHTLPFHPHTMSVEEIQSLRRTAFLRTTLYPSFLWRRLVHVRSWEEVKILGRAASTIGLAVFPALMKSLATAAGRRPSPDSPSFCGTCG
jgi:anaerobic magnesium-protoporphyrin IX monomethyl ester cyclase